MRRSALLVVPASVSLLLALVHCVGDDPVVGGSGVDAGAGDGSSTTPDGGGPTDGAGGSDGAADAVMPPGSWELLANATAFASYSASGMPRNATHARIARKVEPLIHPERAATTSGNIQGFQNRNRHFGTA